jgi:hypothetical protein
LVKEKAIPHRVGMAFAWHNSNHLFFIQCISSGWPVKGNFGSGISVHRRHRGGFRIGGIFHLTAWQEKTILPVTLPKRGVYKKTANL